MNIAQVVAPEFLEAARTMTAQKMADERPTTYELEIISKDGERVTLELSTRLIVSPEGLPVGVQGLGRDITARRQAETSLHRDALAICDHIRIDRRRHRRDEPRPADRHR